MKTWLSILFFVCSAGWAQEFEPVPTRILDRFALVAEEKGLFSVQLYGRSFIEDGRLVSSAPVKARWNEKDMKRCYIIWAGEVKEKRKKPPEIFLNRGKKSLKVLPQKYGWGKSTAWVYAGFAEITDFAQGGDFFITGLKSDPMEPGSRIPYSMAGWAILALTAKEPPARRAGALGAPAPNQRLGTVGAPEVRSEARGAPQGATGKGLSRVAAYLGPDVLSPGEIYEFPVPAQRNETLINLGIVGGHGIRGNAGGNLLNGIPITGKDDWIGSSGKLWDVNLHEVSTPPQDGAWSLGFDPVLQWIFPVAVVIQAR